MGKRTEREITATLLRKIADNINLLTDDQARALRTGIESKFRIFAIYEGNGKPAAQAIKQKNPGRPPATSTNIFIEEAPKGIELKLKRLLKKNLDYGNKVIPNFALGLEELGLISYTAKSKEIFNYLKNLLPEPERELIAGSESNFYRILREIRKDKRKERRKKDFWGKLIKEAL